MTRLGIVTGLKSEARIIRRHFKVREAAEIAAASGAAAHAAAERLVANGADALLSFGIAGGLDASLRPGSLVIAAAVHTPARTFPADNAWASRASARLAHHGPITVGAIAGVDRPAASAFDKAMLSAASKAIAVDMESHRVAEVASRHGVPFLAVRAIADPAFRAIPRVALDATAPNGSVRIGALLYGCLMRPTDTWSLPRLACDYRAAMRALRWAAAEAGPTFSVR